MCETAALKSFVQYGDSNTCCVQTSREAIQMSPTVLAKHDAEQRKSPRQKLNMKSVVWHVFHTFQFWGHQLAQGKNILSVKMGRQHTRGGKAEGLKREKTKGEEERSYQKFDDLRHPVSHFPRRHEFQTNSLPRWVSGPVYVCFDFKKVLLQDLQHIILIAFSSFRGHRLNVIRDVKQSLKRITAQRIHAIGKRLFRWTVVISSEFQNVRSKLAHKRKSLSEFTHEVIHTF